ncbi:hypothetical protein OUZ56_026475 [Daphnia magna]|uniref:Uncharacterized protein n=1 Tax=Daphnia magna TaxID=35525 RepID=A0ABQ9ZLZ1_9CRUS|nr:hypothetical protein OUZ56_026475 [Daphnia magna]
MLYCVFTVLFHHYGFFVIQLTLSISKGLPIPFHNPQHLSVKWALKCHSDCYKPPWNLRNRIMRPITGKSLNKIGDLVATRFGRFRMD